MKGLESAVGLLRPFVDSKNWDYCVVWKLGDDPSRFIEWLGCCCGGAGGGKVKRKRGEEKHSVPLCRDLYFKHSIRTKACEALACFPSFMPLYSGIHGEVVASTQSRWLTQSNNSDSNSSSESVGTRVLIPVYGGLIELFAAKHIAKDQKIIDFITAHFNVLKQEGMIAHCYSSLNECCLDPRPEQNLYTMEAASHLLSLLPATQILYALNQSNTHSSIDGSSCVSNVTNDNPSFDLHSGYLTQNGFLKHSVEKPSGPRKFKCNESLLKHQAGVIPDCGKETAKVIHKSKNLVTERNRRSRINDGLFTLRALVPKISKMNKAAILGDAVEYIGELEKEVKKLQDELKEIEEEECRKGNTELNASESEALFKQRNHLLPDEIDQESASYDKKEKIEVQVEVNQIGKREFLIKLFCEKKQGGFGRLMDAIYSLGLQVADANMTTFNGLVLTILRVEAISKDVQPKRLRESLLKLRG